MHSMNEWSFNQWDQRDLTDFFYCFLQYRHWSISDSLHHTIYTAAKFKIWTHKGKQKLNEFLAELGLPLVQVKQKFATMDLGFRTEVRSMFEEKTEKYSLEDITYNSFVASFGFRHKFCAADVVFAVLALLEQLQESVSFFISDCELLWNLGTL